MKRILLSILLLLSISLSYAQMSPTWMNPKMREMYYSSDDYFTGFMPGSIRAGESSADAMIRVKDDAQSELIRSIRVIVETKTNKTDQQLQSGDSFIFTSLYKNAVQTTAGAKIIGVKTDSYYDEKDNLVYGFAYLEREAMIKYYHNQIELNMQKIADAIKNAEQLNAEGLKVKARQICKEGVDFIANIEYAQDILSAVDKGATPASLFITKASELRNELIKLMAMMSQNFVIYIQSSEDNFRVPSTVLSNKLKAILSKNDCSTTAKKEDADIVIIVEAVTRKHDADNPDIKFAYADVIVKVLDPIKEKELYTDEFSVKGGALSYDSAGKKALDEASQSVWKIISNWIE